MNTNDKKTGIACTLLALVLLMSIGIPSVAALDMMYRANPQHTAQYDSYSGGIVPNGQYKWSYPTGGIVHSSPAVSNAIVFVGSDDTYVRAIRVFDGTLKWSFKTGGKVESSPAVINGIVYIGSNDGSVYAIDAETGIQKWRCYTGGAVMSSPAVAKGVVYVGSNDRNIYAINADTGQKVWNRTLLSEVRLSPALASGLVYTGDDDYLYGLNADDGTIAWKTQVITTYQASSPSIGNGLLYIWAEEAGGWFEAYDALTGAYKYMGGGWPAANSIAVTSDVVYSGGSALDAQTGAELWDYELDVCGNGGFCYDEWGSSPAVSNGRLYVGGRRWDETTNYLYALRTNDGTLAWRYSTGANKILTSPAVYAGMVIFGCDDGKVYAVGNQPAPQPTISAVVPDYGITDTTAMNIIIQGTGLLSVNRVDIKYQETPRSMWTRRDAGNIRYISDQQITCDFDLTDIPPGNWTVELGTSDGKWATAGFGVIVPPVITVTVPNGGESWKAGSSHAITWTQSGLDNTNVRIDLWKNWPAGVYVREIAASVPAGAGTFSWNIPTDVAPSDKYWVNISSLYYPTINDYTDGWLTITAPGYVMASVSPGSVPLGKEVRIRGVNTDNVSTYMYLTDLTGHTCDPNGCPLTDLTQKSSDGYFTRVTNAADASFEYIWDTSTVTGTLIPGTYAIIIESDPVDYAHRSGHPYVRAQIVIDKNLEPIPGYSGSPMDPNGDGIYEDLNGNGRLDFADVVLYFNQMEWIAVHEPVSAFDLNGNGRIDFADIVQLFGEI